MGLNWAEHTVEIEAPIEACFGAIIDYETFPSWQSAVVDTEVLDWDDRGRGKRVRLFVDAKVRKVDYTLDYRYEEPVRIEWDFVEGNGINDADGYYLFEELAPNRTRATYRFGLEVGIPLPGPIARRAHSSTLKASVEDLKREAERRAASAPVVASPPSPGPGDDPKERERRLAEKMGISSPERHAAPPPPPVGDWADGDGAHSVTELPGLVVGRAASAGRRVAEGGIETAVEMTAGAAGAGLDAARRAARLGLSVPVAVADRAARALGRRTNSRQ
jgi:polyketide cyclase/dehydrase/lipid transport protein